jgi:membrane-associated phospholipid phosphatase
MKTTAARTRMRDTLSLLAVIACSTSCLCSHASAQSNEPSTSPASIQLPHTPRLKWDEDWPRFRPIGYALTGASVLAALTVTLFVEYPEDPRWSGGILFDDDVRESLRARNPAARDAIRSASHFTLAATIVQNGLVDSVLLPLADRNPDLAWQLTLMNAQAYSLNILIATLLFKAVARARPLAADCARDPDFDPLCTSGTFASFPSSHTSTAFTAAGLTCVHHAYLPIYGGAWDQAACAEAIVLATATGLFRIIGDRHHTTDVLFGAAFGFSLGYIYPWLMHYRYGNESRSTSSTRGSRARWGLLPAAPYGLTASGELRLDRLGRVHLVPRDECTGTVFVACERRERERGNQAACLRGQRTHLAHQVVAVTHRHADVAHDHVQAP